MCPILSNHIKKIIGHVGNSGTEDILLHIVQLLFKYHCARCRLGYHGL